MSVSLEPSTPATVGLPRPVSGAPALDTHTPRGLAAAYVELTKPRIAVMVLLTVAIGYMLGATGPFHVLALLATVVGTGLVAGGSSAWNMVLERHTDALMNRTLNRPIPSGRLSSRQAAVFGTILAIVGVAILAVGAHSLAAAVAAATFLLYVLVYTPIKTVSTLNTVVGACGNALPPVIGWTAATGRFGPEALALFLILFLWQFPHFLAIAWIYRDDYARGGMKMLPTVDPGGQVTGRHATLYALALLPAGLLPTLIGMAGPWYFAAALVLGVLYLAASVGFWRDVTDTTARRLMRMSFFYLPLVLFALVLNHSHP